MVVCLDDVLMANFHALLAAYTLNLYDSNMAKSCYINCSSNRDLSPKIQDFAILLNFNDSNP